MGMTAGYTLATENALGATPCTVNVHWSDGTTRAHGAGPAFFELMVAAAPDGGSSSSTASESTA